MTHERQQYDAVEKPFLAGIAPLLEKGQLGCLLAQFPWGGFKADSASVLHLGKIADTFVSRGIPVNVEFRHDSWYSEEHYAKLRELGLGFVNVDIPQIGHLPPPSNVTTSDIAYYRFHGRNAKMWFRHPTQSHRYDYSYRDDELQEWVDRVEEIKPQVGSVFIYTNNCRLGSSFVDALRIKDKLGFADPIPVAEPPADLFATEPEDPLEAIARSIAAARDQERPEIEARMEQQATE